MFDFLKKGKKKFKTISSDEAQEMMKKGNSVLVDVRTKAEYDEKHVPNSKLITLDQLKDKAPTELKDKTMNVIVFCQSGGRASSAAQILVDLGYENVYNAGGISKWTGETVSK